MVTTQAQAQGQQVVTKGLRALALILQVGKLTEGPPVQGTYVASALIAKLVHLYFVGRPQGLTEERPGPDLPPCGWSTGFIAVPRTTGLRPAYHISPALPGHSL